MSNNLSMVPPGLEAPASDARSSSQQHQHPGYRRAPRPTPLEAAPPADPEQRLVIQEVGDTGTYVYTVIDRTTGQVVAQASREEVAHMHEQANYAAGSLIKTRA